MPSAPPPDLLSAVYDALRRLAARRLADERPGHTLTATALVHDAYLKLAGADPDRWADAGHFYRAAAEAMRRLLVDHARTRDRDKRGGDRPRVPLAEAMTVAALSDDAADPDDLAALEAALDRLAGVDPALAEIVRLRFYAGLSVDQTAAAMGVSDRDVRRKWTFARAWLFRELSADRP